MSLGIGDMQYRIERDTAQLAAMALKVREASDGGDDEIAHAEEDRLHETALEAIMHHAMSPQVKRLASIALSTKDLDFSRWCA